MLPATTLDAIRVTSDDAQGDWEIPLTETFGARVDIPAKLVEVASLEGLEREPLKKKKPKKKEA